MSRQQQADFTLHNVDGPWTPPEQHFTGMGVHPVSFVNATETTVEVDIPWELNPTDRLLTLAPGPTPTTIHIFVDPRNATDPVKGNRYGCKTRPRRAKCSSCGQSIAQTSDSGSVQQADGGELMYAASPSDGDPVIIIKP